MYCSDVEDYSIQIETENVNMQLKGKLFSSRTLILLIIQFFIIHTYMQGLVECSKAYDYPCAPWVLPFYFSSSYVILINMFMIIYYFSDAPFMQYYNLYRIMRYGRIRYAVANIVAIIAEAVIYMVSSFIFSVICLGGHIDYTSTWGKLLYTIGATNDTRDIQIYMDVSYDLMNNLSPMMAMIQVFVIGIGVFAFVGLLMYVISLYFSRMAAITVAILMTAMAYITVDAVPIFGKKLGYISPISWLYITRINNTYLGVYTLPGLRYILEFLGIGIVVCIVFILIKSKTVNFEFYKED